MGFHKLLVSSVFNFSKKLTFNTIYATVKFIAKKLSIELLLFDEQLFSCSLKCTMGKCICIITFPKSSFRLYKVDIIIPHIFLKTNAFSFNIDC